MSLASSLRNALDEARVALASHPAVTQIEEHFQLLNELGDDPGAREKALDIIRGLYEAHPAEPGVPPTAPGADAATSPPAATAATGASSAGLLPEPEPLPPPGPGTTPVPDSTPLPGSPESSAPADPGSDAAG